MVRRNCSATHLTAMPIMASYVMAKCKPRTPRRLLAKVPELVASLREEYRKTEMYKRYWG